MNDHRQQVATLLVFKPDLSVTSISRKLNINRRTVSRILKNLEQDSMIFRSGSTNNQKFIITDAFRKRVERKYYEK